jgi:hypothetical protein
MGINFLQYFQRHGPLQERSPDSNFAQRNDRTRGSNQFSKRDPPQGFFRMLVNPV